MYQSFSNLIHCAVNKGFTVKLSRSSGETLIHTSDSTIGTCTEHHEARTGRTSCSLAGLSIPKAGFIRVCTHPLTHPRQCDGNGTILKNGAIFRVDTESEVCALLESGSARRLLPPESVSIGSLSAGAASAHTRTHTQSPFATPSPPMGVRGRGL